MSIPFLRKEDVKSAIKKIKRDGKSYKSSNLNDFTSFLKNEFYDAEEMLGMIDTYVQRTNNIPQICIDRLQKKLWNTKTIWKLLGKLLVIIIF